MSWAPLFSRGGGGSCGRASACHASRERQVIGFCSRACVLGTGRRIRRAVVHMDPNLNQRARVEIGLAAVTIADNVEFRLCPVRRDIDDRVAAGYCGGIAVGFAPTPSRRAKIRT